MKGSSIGAAVRLRFRLEFFDDLHLLEVDYTDGVVVCVRGVELFEFRYIFNAFGTRCIGYDRDDTVCAQVDHIGLVRGEVRRDQVAIVLINRQVIKPLSPWTWQVKRGDFLQRRSCLGDSRCCNAQKESSTQKPNSLSHRAPQHYISLLRSNMAQSCFDSRSHRLRTTNSP